MTDDTTPAKTAYSNSHKSKEIAKNGEEPTAEKKKLDRVTTSDPVRVRVPLGRKIASAFKGDDVKSVGDYILMDVLVPAAKTTISDMFAQGVERLLFGDGRRPSSSVGRQGYNTAYNRMSPSASVRRDEPRTISQRARGSHDFSEVVLADRAEAEIVLDTLREQVDQYNSATVADLYELVGITGTFTDNKWGWTDLRQASIRRDRSGWLIDVPRPVELR